jgi:hypothetical protein
MKKILSPFKTDECEGKLRLDQGFGYPTCKNRADRFQENQQAEDDSKNDQRRIVYLLE